MRKLMTTTMLAIMLGVSGLALTACDQGNNNADRSAPGATPNAPNAPDQSIPGGSTPDGGGMGSPNGGLGS